MQDANALRARYERIMALLREARKDIPVTHLNAADADADIVRPGRRQGGQDEFEKFMGVGEYEYAWHALVSTAALHAPTPAFWPQMAEAAVLLIQNAHKPEFRESVHDVLRRYAPLRAALDDLPAHMSDEHARATVAALVHGLEGA